MKYKRELIQKFNLLLNRINKLTEKDWLELQNLSDAFLEDFEKIIPSWDPGMRYKIFKRTIDEFVSEEKKAKNIVLYYNKNEELDQYDWVRDCCYVVEHTLSELLVLLVYYHPERLKGDSGLGKRILERLPYSPKKEIVRQRLLSIAKEETESSKETEALRLKTTSGPQTLRDIFKIESMYQSCINILKEVNPPLINDAETWIGQPKGAVCLWLQLLKQKDLIKYYSDEIYAEVINRKFQPWSIELSNFRKSHKRAEELYKWQFEDKISQLSQ